NDFTFCFGPSISSSPTGLTSGRPDLPGPLALGPLQPLHRYYGPVRPCASHRYSAPRGVRHLGSSLSATSLLRLIVGIEATGSPLPFQRLRQAHATYTPGTTRATSRQLPG